MKEKIKKNKLKLTIELVPSTSWYKNFRTVLSPSEWRKIREKTLTKYRNKCGICGATKGRKWRLHCHERWKYDDKRHIQKLIGFIPLCNLCHFTKHMGFAGILETEGWLGKNEVVRHFTKINNCNRKVFEEHVKEAFEKWYERSQYEWQINFGRYKKLICGKNKKLQKKIENYENYWKSKILKTRLNCPECKRGHLVMHGKKVRWDRPVRIKGRLINRKGEIDYFFKCECDRYPVCQCRCMCSFDIGCGNMNIAASMIPYKKRLVKLLDKLKI